MPSVDVITWHPLFSTSPEYESQYYYEYPSIVQQIKETAYAHGFRGGIHGGGICLQEPRLHVV